MIPALVELKAELDAIDGRLWFVLIAVVVGFFVWAWKKLHRRSFDALPGRLKALPATAMAAALSASAHEEFWPILLEAVLGGFSGVTAVGGQEFWDRLVSGTKAERAERKRRLSERPPAPSDDEEEP